MKYRLASTHAFRLSALLCATLALGGCTENADGEAAPGSERVAEAAGASAVVGAWQAPVAMPLDAAHAVLLPTGKVWLFGPNDGTFIFDPILETLRSSASFGYNPFSSGHALLPSGEVLIAGGHNNANGYGQRNVSIFDPSRERLTMVDDLPFPRWTPAAITLASGDLLIIDGFNQGTFDHVTTPVVWETQTRTFRPLTGAVKSLTPYVRAHLAPNGKVFVAGPDLGAGFFDTAGTGSWALSDALSTNRFYGATVQYEPGKILAVGGTGAGGTSLKTAEIIDLGAANLNWVATGAMTFPRQLLNAVLLPDGKVLVIGGSSAPGFNNQTGPVFDAEMWDPATGVFTVMAPNAVYRGFHANAMLLPDGRVLSMGGVGHEDYEIYSPPYLFQGPQPELSGVPSAIDYGATFSVTSADAASVQKVSMLRLTSTTQGTISDQRAAFLTSTPTATGLSITMIAKPELGPPGDYLLFLLNDLGVPSKGAIFRLGNGVGTAPTVPRPPRDLVAKALSATTIKLGWRDDSANEDGFKIERVQSGNRWVELATVGANVTTFVDSDPQLLPKTTYLYRVRAHGPQGHSPYSDKVRVVTP